MLNWLALQFDQPRVRGALVFIGVLVTLFLAPLTLYLASLGVFALFGPDMDTRERLMLFPACAMGLAGVFGLAAAWCRVVASNLQLQTSKALFVFTVVGLSIGIVPAVYGSLGLLRGATLGGVSWGFLVVAIMGAAMLGATIGARRLRPSTSL